VNKKIGIGIGIVIAVFLIVKGLSFFKSAGSSQNDNLGKDNAASLYEQAVALEAASEPLEARELYKKIVADFSDFDKIEDVQKKLEAINTKIILSSMETPSTVIYIVEPGDSLAKIAKKHKTTVALIKKSNQLKSDVIRVGQKIRIWKDTFSVFVDKSQNILILKSNGEIVKVYAVSTGANNSTPVGTFKIVVKQVNPVWFKSGQVIPPESPENVLGTRWMGFDNPPDYGIHGTTEPQNIGKQVTAGCVRMRNADVEELYDFLPEGTEVTVVD
jgi:lipoprotein-anchoring transpeptidase ErfK/SrfK